MAEDTNPMEMIVRLQVNPSRTTVVLDRLRAEVEQTRLEDGTLEFVVFTSETPGEIWLKEAFVSKEYHDNVHESAPILKELIEWLPGEVVEPWTVATITRALER
jgi:quinol monooxygenase YgiN